MKATLFYMTAFLWVGLLTVCEEMIFCHYCAYLLILFGTIALTLSAFKILTEEEVKKYSGWNLWCKLLKTNNEL